MAPERSVAKGAVDAGRARRTVHDFDRARDAIGAFFDAAGLGAGSVVLCPAYVGWSPREGSGLLDPLTRRGFDVRYYRVSPSLGIDLAHLGELLAGGDVAGLIVVPFFGRLPDGYARAIELGREFGAWTLEDGAHALLTDLIEGRTGRAGHGAVFSLHKFLPVPDGGLLVTDPEARLERAGLAPAGGRALTLLSYDLAAIAATRRTNARLLGDLLQPLAGEVDPLWPALRQGEVLQTLPTVIRAADRDQVYERMNEAGFGVTSLYHTLVGGITPGEFPDSHWLSRHILNLPIHQDVTPDGLERLVAALTATVRTP